MLRSRKLRARSQLDKALLTGENDTLPLSLKSLFTKKDRSSYCTL